MKIFFNTVLVIGSLILMGFVLIVVLSDTEKEKSVGTGVGDSYEADHQRISQSNQVIEPYDLARNPYMLNGKSGILKTLGVPLIDQFGRSLGDVAFPALRYSNMLDGQTAVYNVITARNFGTEEDGQIAIRLDPDSARPEIGRPWRVAVESPLRVTNGFGAESSIASLTFLGYGTIAPPPLPPTPQLAPPPPTLLQQPSAPPDEPSDRPEADSTASPGTPTN